MILITNHLLCVEQVKPTGVFSNMVLFEEEGDLIGEEFIIMYGASRYWILIQLSAGEPQKPILAQAEINKNAVSFNFIDAIINKPTYFSGYATVFL